MKNKPVKLPSVENLAKLTELESMDFDCTVQRLVWMAKKAQPLIPALKRYRFEASGINASRGVRRADTVKLGRKAALMARVDLIERFLVEVRAEIAGLKDD